jgi:hypothetical protein
MDPQSSLVISHEPVTGLYHEPAESSLHAHNCFFKIYDLINLEEPVWKVSKFGG